MTTIHLAPLTFEDGSRRAAPISRSEPTAPVALNVPETPTSVDADYYDDMLDTEEPEVQQTIPVHPIPLLQDAFAESLHEVTAGGAESKTKLREFDARQRRERLLEQGKDDEPFDLQWRYRPDQEQHEVPKLVAQISFGVYLLLRGMANDNSQVVNILQGHIDEVDEFLEVVLEDLAQTAQDLTERVDFLQLPMRNMQVFEEMLEDRQYRAEILEGNEKIEHMLARTNATMKQWDDDVDAGLQCTSAFKEWLITQRDGPWRTERPDLVEIYDAMQGNADGWLSAFDEMNSRAQDMNSLIIKLMTIVSDMENKAGEISRKTWSSITPFTAPTHNNHQSGWDTNSSISSRHTSQRSNPRSMTQASVQSGSITTLQASRVEEEEEEEQDFDDLMDFPLPGSLPLLPPIRQSKRMSKKKSMQSLDSNKLRVETIAIAPPIQEASSDVEDNDEPLFLLQPRTYTPKPPEVTPSPVARADSPSVASTASSPRKPSGLGLQKKASLRQRVSLKFSPPEDIIIPPRTFNDARRGSGHSSQQSSRFIGSPHSSSTSKNSRGRNPSHSSSSEVEAFRQHNLPRMNSHMELGQRLTRPPLMQSPNSDYQFYQPVRASPHSPLQQRPHTAAGPQDGGQTGYFNHHVRNQPSRLGGMSTLSSVTTATQDARARPRGAPSVATGKSLKKKKSAFGWLKKAFTLDDEERASYQQRKQTQHEAIYYKDKSPKFLDGRRLRE